MNFVLVLVEYIGIFLGISIKKAKFSYGHIWINVNKQSHSLSFISTKAMPTLEDKGQK